MAGEKTGANPTDRGKRGTKRSLLTEGHGVPIGLLVDGANRHDMKLTQGTLESVVIERPEPTPEHPRHLCLDKGYDYNEVRELVEAYGYSAHIPTRGEELARLDGEAPARGRPGDAVQGAAGDQQQE